MVLTMDVENHSVSAFCKTPCCVNIRTSLSTSLSSRNLNTLGALKVKWTLSASLSFYFLDEHRQCVCKKLIEPLLQLFYLSIYFDDFMPCSSHSCKSNQCMSSVFHPGGSLCSQVCSQFHSPYILSLGFLNLWLDVFVLHTFVCLWL